VPGWVVRRRVEYRVYQLHGRCVQSVRWFECIGVLDVCRWQVQCNVGCECVYAVCGRLLPGRFDADGVSAMCRRQHQRWWRGYVLRRVHTRLVHTRHRRTMRPVPGRLARREYVVVDV
jgi:hypothetical protein